MILLSQEITHERNIHSIMRELARDFGDVLDNALPQETVEVGLVEVGGSGGGIGYGGLFE